MRLKFNKLLSLNLMVVAVFPLAKIGLLLLKQLSKPVANLIKNEAKRHPQVRKYVIVPIGKAYWWIENKALSSVIGTKPNEVEPVTEEEAVELGANAMGEIILFGILCLILLAEINRQGDKKAEKEKTKAEELTNLQDTVLELNDEILQLKKTVEALKRAVENPPTFFDFEERRMHISDQNFWDIFNSRKMVKTGLDKSSPSL